MHQKKMATNAGDISLPDVSKLNDLKDDPIEALIEKLAEVQAHAPQIIAALEQQQEARSRGSKSQGSKGGERKVSSDRGERTHPPNRQAQQHYVEETFEEEDEDDEEYDDFDEDAEYPMVGEGYSDELSVVSDMTTPTVVSSLEINEEEYYRDMVVGGMKVNAPKKKDLLSQVAKTNARKAPIVAGKKKVGVPANDTALKKPARVASIHSARADGKVAGGAKEVKKKKSKDGVATTPSGTKKIKKKTTKKKSASPNNSGTGWDTANGGPSAGASKRKGPQEKAAPVMIDDDGFLVDQSTFETFDSSNNPFARAPSFTADPSTAEDTFGAFADFGAPEPAPTKKSSKPKKLNVTSTGKKKNSSSSSQAGSSSPKQKRKGTRRKSLGM